MLGSEPESIWIMGFGLLALLANVWCLLLIAKHRHGEIHMRASWIFSKNDVIANVGVILGGFLVYLFNSHLPDLLIGFAIALIVIRGGISIIKDASKGAEHQMKTLNLMGSEFTADLGLDPLSAERSVLTSDRQSPK